MMLINRRRRGDLYDGDYQEEEGGIEDVLAIFRIFKLARVLKLARSKVKVNSKFLFQAFTQDNITPQVPDFVGF